jgi:hypothetical protein
MTVAWLAGRLNPTMKLTYEDLNSRIRSRQAVLAAVDARTAGTHSNLTEALGPWIEQDQTTLAVRHGSGFGAAGKYRTMPNKAVLAGQSRFGHGRRCQGVPSWTGRGRRLRAHHVPTGPGPHAATSGRVVAANWLAVVLVPCFAVGQKLLAGMLELNYEKMILPETSPSRRLPRGTRLSHRRTAPAPRQPLTAGPACDRANVCGG